MDQTSGVVINRALSVGGDFIAPNLYNKTQVDYIASTRQPTITVLSSFNANNITAVRAIIVANNFTDGTVNVASINTGAINASSLTPTGLNSVGSITTSGAIASASLTATGAISGGIITNIRSYRIQYINSKNLYNEWVQFVSEGDRIQIRLKNNMHMLDLSSTRTIMYNEVFINDFI